MAAEGLDPGTIPNPTKPRARPSAHTNRRELTPHRTHSPTTLAEGLDPGTIPTP